MRHGSLFSGIGGFDLAAEWMGWENVFHCEWNEFGQKVLKYYWPNAISYGDITKTDFTVHRGTIDILTGGFPCQPYSMAGKRKGKADERHLWPEMLRAIREIQPSWIVGENVPGIINWSEGLVFHEVQTDLETEGYEVFPVVLPACGVNAPHKRERVWFVAHSVSEPSRIKPRQISDKKWRPDEDRRTSVRQIHGQTSTSGINSTSGVITNSDSNGHELRGFGENRQTQGESISKQEQRERIWTDDRGNGEQGNVTDTKPTRLEGRIITSESKWDKGSEIWRNSPGLYQKSDWIYFPTQPPLCSRDDGFSSRLDGITFPKWRNESIKGFGNAVVPQLPFKIFKAIEEYNEKQIAV